ncbi:DUF4393 domain-containing protein [Acinetobacter baumannii]|uniref:DUF4393 domain-containing protein n=1 Tax=Acinetobacter baumannii TaxID=470 RepID=UPI001D25B04C|nr:DUF4393 domain-containing protein [Acinetobacter baumannii]EHU1558918.1 DUF4393 domain-containing protein [Acinetobacter baumannii]MDH2513104.1 DUF4393 domain-containing protein [Acinetobacter baumannii]HAV5500983.1 DUF4393 domain-containing protein [Acinetobacter baumannii]
MEIKDLSGLGAYSPILYELYKDMAQPAARNVGLALGAITSIGLFLHLLTSWGTERINLRLKDNLVKYADRLKDFPEEEIVQAPPEVAMPIMEKLSYVTNEELKELYIELLAKASIKDLNDSAHPSFINIINNLSPDEALLLGYLKDRPYLPYVDIILKGINNIQYHLEDLVCLTPGLDLNFQNNFKAYLCNLESCGLVNVLPDRVFVDEKEYEIYINYMNNNLIHYEKNFKDLKKDPFSKSPYQLIKGTIEVTDFGHLFFKAVY